MVNTTNYCPSLKLTLPTMVPLCHGLGASCGGRCLHTLPPHPAYRSNSSNETGHVPLKEPIGALLIWQWHMVEFDWCHMSQFEWRSFKTFSPRHTVSFDWLKCINFQVGKSQHSIGLLVSLPTCVNMWLAFACFLCFCFSDTWQIYVGVQILAMEPSSSIPCGLSDMMWQLVVG